MNYRFSLAGRSFAAPTPNLSLSHASRILYAPYIALCDGAVTRLVLSNHLPVRNNVRLQVFNVRGEVMHVRWAGPYPQSDLVLQLPPFVTRYVEIDGSDCANSQHAWVMIEMTSVGVTGYSLTSNPVDPGMSVYQPLTDGAETCVRLPFDVEDGKLTFCSLLNLSVNAEEAREFAIGFYFANAPNGEHLLAKVPGGHAVAVDPELAKIRDQAGILEIRPIDDGANFAVSGFWRHPTGQRGVLPPLPGTGSRV